VVGRVVEDLVRPILGRGSSRARLGHSQSTGCSCLALVDVAAMVASGVAAVVAAALGAVARRSVVVVGGGCGARWS